MIKNLHYLLYTPN